MAAKIVYIDDEPMLCRAFRAVLASADIAVETFTDVDAALEYIRAHDVAAVFCDYRMPTVTGADVLDRIDRPIAFYFVSGDLEAANAVEGDPRVTGILPKPYRPAALLALVKPYVDGPSP